ncbi:kelch repeat protein [Leptospira phage vB_LalZ_80412-LE1]|nr:kelch repeat protein [Leptospira phage vB_LalZ_80412-LE1]
MSVEIGADASPVSEIDFFDPVTSTWYPAATSIPTPRAFANIVSHKNKIYVIGGLEKQGINYVASKKTEVYDPYTISGQLLPIYPSPIKAELSQA